ncbi:MAG TPA: PHB depolymerase family esterase [Solimonas sp.]|nr:PHB depolymerase family esterase [Solimonas sp.]
MSFRFLRRALIASLAALPLCAHAAFGDGLKTLVGGLGTTLTTLGGGLQETLARLNHSYLEPTEGTSSFEEDFVYQGVTREVLYIMPNVQTAPLAPAVVLLHYHYGTPQVMANLVEAGRLAAEHGAWLIIPKADGEWQEDPGKTTGADDVGFLSALIAHAVALRPLDAKRIYMAGMSNGGFMAGRFACERADLIAGTAIVAATLRKSQSSACTPSRVVPMTIVLGSSDSRINLEANLGLGILTGQATFDRFAALNGCNPAQTIESQLPDIANDGTVTTLREAGGCAPGGAVRYYAIQNGGHTWPQGNYTGLSLLGKVAQDFNATDAIWDFFEPLHLP